MPLATKNNALIVKDGKIAENCGCCGEWYCDGTPASLTATVSLNIGAAIYTAFAPGFYLPVSRITSLHANAISTTYSLTPLGDCSFIYTNNVKRDFTGRLVYMGLSDTIRLSVTQLPSCAGLTAVSVSEFGLWIDADSSESATSFSDVPRNDNTCKGYKDAWSNAGNRQFFASSNNLPSFYFKATKVIGLEGCSESAYYVAGQPTYRVSGLTYVASSGSAIDRCVKTLAVLDETWLYDVIYIDTAGSQPDEKTLRSALSLRIKAT